MTGIKMLSLVVLLAVVCDALGRSMPILPPLVRPIPGELSRGKIPLAGVHATVIGGFSKVNANSPGVKSIADFAVHSIQVSINSPFKFGLEKIVSAQEQVVHGTNYKLSLIVNVSNCHPPGYVVKKTDAPVPSYCSITKFNDCDVEVYELKPEHILRLMSYSCKPSKYKRNYATGLLPSPRVM